jgi:hypothetical protein
MKKQINPFILFSLIGICYSLSSMGQTSTGELSGIASGSHSGTHLDNKTGYTRDHESTEINLLTTRLQKRFSKIYPEANSSKWIKLDNCFGVSFISNGQKTTAVFYENGKLNYAVTDLKNENIPAGLQQIIKKDYDGLSILNAIEINDNGNIVHQVILENSSSYITLKASGDELEVIKTKNASADKPKP